MPVRRLAIMHQGDDEETEPSRMKGLESALQKHWKHCGLAVNLIRKVK